VRLIERTARLEQQLKTVLDREAESQRRHDAKVDKLEAKIKRLNFACQCNGDENRQRIQYLEKQLANARREAWISVEDKFPWESGVYLVRWHYPHETSNKDHINLIDFDFYGSDEEMIWEDDSIRDYITHWMEIPPLIDTPAAPETKS